MIITDAGRRYTTHTKEYYNILNTQEMPNIIITVMMFTGRESTRTPYRLRTRTHAELHSQSAVQSALAIGPGNTQARYRCTTRVQDEMVHARRGKDDTVTGG